MALHISLNGSNYVSYKTREAFEQALQETGSKDQESRIENRQIGEAADQPPTHHPQSTTPIAQLSTLDHVLAQSYEHQTLAMRIHEQYLHNQSDYGRIFSELMQQQGTIFAQAAAASQLTEMTAVLETLARSMARFHDLQEQTLNVHKQFLAQQSDYARATIQLLAGERIGESANERMGECQPVLVESPKSKVESRPIHGGETVKRGNGNGNGNGHHPQDTGIEHPTLNLEHPVPSIAPSVSSIQHRESADQRISENLSVPSSPHHLATPSHSLSVPPSPLPSLVPSLLAIVSEKTGYPADMLELDMDMEADLGIDSIKRVEILGALQDAHPELPEVSPDVLAELRTLRQIVDRMQETGSSKQESTERRSGEFVDSQALVSNPQSLKKG
ncbi:MAG TPA: phosphopantetheine-binding protein [Anaerolineae bacterium]|nr:phosphopantetheine-binding protein [Anaerolineae bacterium]HQH39001.1 phosphopantetheine-binding protein [Anaerolineae bacterium]